MSTRAASFVDTVLTAGILAAVVSPIPFLLLGVRGALDPALYAVALPPYLLAGGFLLARYLARPSERAPRRPLSIALAGALELVAWIVIASLLYVVSQINLLVGIERLGAICELAFFEGLVWLPIAIKRRTVLERRLSALPIVVARAILLAVVLAAGAIAILDLITPPRFPH